MHSFIQQIFPKHCVLDTALETSDALVGKIQPPPSRSIRYTGTERYMVIVINAMKKHRVMRQSELRQGLFLNEVVVKCSQRLTDIRKQTSGRSEE